jgi:transposase-like protein
MRKSRFSEEQIIGILKEHQAGLPVTELCRKHGISDGTFYAWRSPRKQGMRCIEIATSTPWVGCVLNAAISTMQLN